LENRINNIFCWLNEITELKTPTKEFTDKDWDKFNSYMVHRFISMNLFYTELANIAQSLMPNNKRDIYNFYKEMLPKRKAYFRYIKSKNKTTNNDLLNKIAFYFKVGEAEADAYINILGKEGMVTILTEMGLDKKEIKKLLKCKEIK
tara:strand:+ start:8275 stop:8715 length:441 start_codon:yes stop_codon:yes gene_type:complete